MTYSYSRLFQVQKKVITRNGRGAESEPHWKGSRRQLKGRRHAKLHRYLGEYGFLTAAKDTSQYKQSQVGGERGE